MARNTSVLTAAACAEQASRPYVCKHSMFYIWVFFFKTNRLFLIFILAIDRCYNNSGGCGKYGTCLNLPLLNSHKCQCRFLYSGDRCEKCKLFNKFQTVFVSEYFNYLGSSQGLQAIIGCIIIVIAFIATYIINLERSGERWSFQKSTVDYYQTYVDP